MNSKRQLVFVDSENSKIKTLNLSLSKIFLILLFFFLLTGLIMKYSIDYLIDFSHNSRIVQLKNENAMLSQQLSTMMAKIEAVESQVARIEEMDDNLRQMMDLPEISEDIRQVGIGGTNLENPIIHSSSPLGKEVTATQSLLEKLEREIKLEMDSYRKLVTTVERREDSLRYLPALKPVPNGRVTDGYGNRRHPILKRIRFHYGVDLAANKGTPILAPADGYVTFTGRNGGYGLFVTINHKYGFITRYGHMNKIYVRTGQFVRRGDKIGEVGNTGLSTNPHLHYEVLLKGKHKDPDGFFLNDAG